MFALKDYRRARINPDKYIVWLRQLYTRPMLKMQIHVSFPLPVILEGRKRLIRDKIWFGCKGKLTRNWD